MERNKRDKQGHYQYNTGDIFMEKEGIYYCKGRLDHSFKKNGIRMNILNLEYNYKRILKIKNLYAVFLKKYEKICLVSENTLVEKDLKKLKSRLPKPKVPEFYFVMKDISRTSTGKLSRKSLEDYCANQVNI